MSSSLRMAAVLAFGWRSLNRDRGCGIMTTVRLYVLQPDGSLLSHSESPLSGYGACPNVGDTLCFSWRHRDPENFSVQRRYFVDNRDGHQGWAIILRPVDNAPPVQALLKEWYIDDDLWDEHEAEDKREEEEKVEKLLAALRGADGPIQPPLNSLERSAISWLASRKAGLKVPIKAIPGFGPSTKKKLAERGLISATSDDGTPDKNELVSLTAEGRRLWKLQKAYDHPA